MMRKQNLLHRTATVALLSSTRIGLPVFSLFFRPTRSFGTCTGLFGARLKRFGRFVCFVWIMGGPAFFGGCRKDTDPKHSSAHRGRKTRRATPSGKAADGTGRNSGGSQTTPRYAPPDHALLFVRSTHARSRNRLQVVAHNPRTGGRKTVFDSWESKNLGVDLRTAVCRAGNVYFTGYTVKKNEKAGQETVSATKQYPRWLYRVSTTPPSRVKGLLRLKEPRLAFAMDARGKRIAYWAKGHLWVQTLAGKVQIQRKIPHVRHVHVLDFLPDGKHVHIRIEQTPKGHGREDDPAGLFRVPLAENPDTHPMDQIYTRKDTPCHRNAKGDALFIESHSGGPTALTVKNAASKTIRGPFVTPANLPHGRNQAGNLALDPSGRWVAYRGRHGDVWVTDMALGRHRRVAFGFQKWSRICWGPVLDSHATAPPVVESDRLESVSMDRGNRTPATGWKPPGTLPKGMLVLAPPGAVQSLVFSPRRKAFVSVGRDKRVRYFRPRQSRAHRQARGLCNGRTRRLKVAGRGRWLLYLGSSRVCIADHKTSKPISQSASDARFVAATPTGRLAVVGHGKNVRFIDLEAGRWSGPFKTCRQRGVALSPRGDHLAVVCADGKTDLYRLQFSANAPSLITDLKRKHIRRIKNVGATARHPLFSEDGKILALIEGAAVGLWECPTGRRLGTLRKHPMWLTALAFDPRGRRAATAGQEGTLRVWDVDSKKTIKRLKPRLGRVAELAFSSDGKWLGAGSADDGSIALFDTRTWRLEQRWAAHHPKLKALSLDPDRRVVTAAHGDDRLRIWTIPQGHLLVSLPENEVVSMTIGHNGRLLTVFGRYTTMHWDLHTGKSFTATSKPSAFLNQNVWAAAKKERLRFCRLYEKRRRGDEYPLVTPMRMDATKDLTVGSLRLADPRQIANLQRYYRPAACPGKGMFSPPNRLSARSIPPRGVLSPDGKVFAALTARKHVALWTIEGWRRRFVSKERPISALAFDPTGKRISAGTRAYGRIVVHAVETGKQLARFNAYQPRAISFTPDGKKLYVGGRADGRVVVFDPQSGKKLSHRRLHASRVVALRFSRDHKLWLTAGQSGRIQLYPFQP